MLKGEQENEQRFNPFVDDDLHVLKSTASWLKEIGFTVTEVAKLSTAPGCNPPLTI